MTKVCISHSDSNEENEHDHDTHKRIHTQIEPENCKRFRSTGRCCEKSL